jgi:hypothetical protein
MATGTSWAALKRELSQLSRDESLNLIKDLYDASASNKAFLTARILGAQFSLDDYKERLRIAFFSRSKNGPTNGYPKIREAKLVLSEFKKARPNDLRNYTDLQIAYAESGIQLSKEFGWQLTPFYRSLFSVLSEVLMVLGQPENQTMYTQFLVRLQAFNEDSMHLGEGYHDEIHARLTEIAAAHNQTDVFPARVRHHLGRLHYILEVGEE